MKTRNLLVSAVLMSFATTADARLIMLCQGEKAFCTATCTSLGGTFDPRMIGVGSQSGWGCTAAGINPAVDAAIQKEARVQVPTTTQ